MRMKSRSQTITEAEDRMPPVHPGEMLREEFLVPMGLSAHALAMAIQVPATRIAEIVKEKRGISGDTAVRLGRYFRTTAEFWMNLQSHYELELARDNMAPGVEEAIKPASVDEKTGKLQVLRTA
jgi:addiction module HigA family antidote